MFNKLNGIYARRKELTKKLIQNPFFPILFIGEAVKTQTILFATTGVLFQTQVLALSIVAVLVTIIWIYAEYILDEVEEQVGQLNDE